jgi:hypothetical protein
VEGGDCPAADRVCDTHPQLHTLQELLQLAAVIFGKYLASSCTSNEALNGAVMGTKDGGRVIAHTALDPIWLEDATPILRCLKLSFYIQLTFEM